MSEAYARPKYSGSTPGNDSNDYILFSTTTAFPYAACALQMSGVHKLQLTLVNSQAGTLKAYYSSDRGTNWTQTENTSVSAAAANSTNPYDYLVEAYPDIKIVWTNGGSAQATWIVSMALIDSRTATT